MSYCHTVTLSHCHTVTMWQCESVTMPHCHSVTLSHCHIVTLLHCHTVTLSHCHTGTLSHCHTVTLSYCHTVTLSHCHTVTLSHCHTVILSHCHIVTLSQTDTLPFATISSRYKHVNLQILSEPQTRGGPFPYFPPLSCFFKHQIKTSITQSFLKLEHFLIPFLKTRSHDRSAHTFGSSLQFLEVPQKWVFKKIWFF